MLRDYKDITKTIANRLKLVLPNLISLNQSAYLPNKKIHDNVITAFEIRHTINKRKKGNKGYLALKLDMAKAYEWVEWRFIKAVMTKFVFPRHWTILIQECISTSHLAFIINGKRVGGVRPTKGYVRVAHSLHTFFSYVQKPSPAHSTSLILAKIFLELDVVAPALPLTIFFCR